MLEKNKELKTFFDRLLGDKPEENIKIIKASKNFRSLKKLALYFRVGRTWLNDIWLKKYLNQKYGHDRAAIIKKNLWPPDSVGIKAKKSKFREKISSLLKLYPENIEKIDGINKLAKKIGVTKITILKWIDDYLKQYYNVDTAKVMYRQIWKSRKGTERKIKYEYIKTIVEKKRGKLITSYEIFNNMKAKPTQRYVDIECEKGHIWSANILHLLYHDRWCPSCSEYLCQKLSRSFMEKIFGVEFKPEITLKKAFGINSKIVYKKIHFQNNKFHFKINAEKLRFDGYSGNIKLQGNDGKIYNLQLAIEYDGIHHDEYPNYFHKSLKEFCLQHSRDQIKNSEAKNHDTILIRLKKSKNFSLNTFKHYPKKVRKEIIKQFNYQIKKFLGIQSIRLKF